MFNNNKLILLNVIALYCMYKHLSVSIRTMRFVSFSFRLKQLICHLKEEDTAEIDTETIISNLEYISEVVQSIVLKTE